MSSPGPRYAEALAWARELHQAQIRKGSGTPYLAHLLSVSALVLEHGGDEDQAIAGLLHDAVEDCGGAPILAEIERRFGSRVASIVAACTDATVVPKPPWRARKEAYLRHLADEVETEALLVSVADKLHNARAILEDYRVIGPELWPRFRGGRDGTLWYYDRLRAIYASRPDAPARLVGMLERTLAELESLVAAREPGS
jgi:(p)ppGpp synthase/HD superfamily hydrolase